MTNSGFYIKTVKKKAHVDPISLMQQRIVVRADEYPFLDPFNPPFDYSNGDSDWVTPFY